ncbi:hypothetical protein D3C85_1406800 [compost metagenome]
MEVAALIETNQRQSIICTGSYNSPERIFDIFVVTDRNSYRLDILRGTLTRGADQLEVDSERTNNAQVARDFVNAIYSGREPLVSARSVLPAMRVLHQIEQSQQR